MKRRFECFVSKGLYKLYRVKAAPISIPLFLVLFLYGCGGSSDDEETYRLRVGSGHPVNGLSHMEVFDNFYLPEVAMRVKEQTGANIVWSKSYAGSLAKLTETLDATESGLLDIGVINYPHNPSQLATYSFPFHFPFQTADAVLATQAVRMTFEKVPWLMTHFEEEYNQKLLAIGANGNYGIGTTFPFTQYSDLAGKKIGAAGPNLKWFQNTDVTTVTASLGEAYSALKTGTYDGVVIFPGAYHGYNLGEAGQHFSVVNFGSPSALSINMNLQTWDGLPVAIQNIFLEVGAEYEIKAAEASNKDDADGLLGLREIGVEIHYFPLQEQRKWAIALADYPNSQAKLADERGDPGTEIYKAYVESMKEVGHEWPYEYVIE